MVKVLTSKIKKQKSNPSFKADLGMLSVTTETESLVSPDLKIDNDRYEIDGLGSDADISDLELEEAAAIFSNFVRRNSIEDLFGSRVSVSSSSNII
jgi:hypothetical protein